VAANSSAMDDTSRVVGLLRAVGDLRLLLGADLAFAAAAAEAGRPALAGALVGDGVDQLAFFAQEARRTLGP
jgi:hypothetical protein